jgi:hypothetical protein
VLARAEDTLTKPEPDLPAIVWGSSFPSSIAHFSWSKSVAVGKKVTTAGYPNLSLNLNRAIYFLIAFLAL